MVSKIVDHKDFQLSMGNYPAGTVRTMYLHCTYIVPTVRTMYVHCTYSARWVFTIAVISHIKVRNDSPSNCYKV